VSDVEVWLLFYELVAELDRILVRLHLESSCRRRALVNLLLPLDRPPFPQLPLLSLGSPWQTRYRLARTVSGDGLTADGRELAVF